jgi:hypothetical protein
MASTSLAKKPASFMRQHTQAVRDHSAAMARVTDQYMAGLKRLEAQYFDGVKRITDAITAETGPDPAETATDQVA